MSSDSPTTLPYASPTRDAAFPPAVRVAAIVYAVAVILRHATYWSRAMLLGGRPNVSAGLALIEVATLVALLVLIVGRRPRAGGIVGCAVILLVVTAGNLAVDFATNDVRANGEGVLRAAWLIATRAQFCAIPVMLLVASRERRDLSR